MLGQFVAEAGNERLQRGDDKLAAAYPTKDLDAWATRARSWAKGEAASDLPLLAPAEAKPKPRDVFLYFIHEGKLKAPQAAVALIERL